MYFSRLIQIKNKKIKSRNKKNMPVKGTGTLDLQWERWAPQVRQG